MLKYLKYQIQKMNEGNNIIISIITWIFIVVLICIVFYLICIGSQNICYSIFNSEKAGQIGDSAGLLNSIFSGLAFLGVIVTIFLQGKELKQTREELKGQKEQFEIQNKTLKRQQFENTFFKLFSLFIEIRDKVGIVEYNQNNKGEKYFSQIFSDWNININKIDVNDNFFKKLIELKYLLCNGGNTIGVSGNFKDILKKIGIEFYKFKGIKDRTIVPFIAYYNHLFNTINFVDSSSNIENTKKQEYINYLIDILSQNEMLVIFCIAYDDNNMKKLIEKYHVFKNLLDETMPDSKWKSMYYNNSAFVSR